MTMNEFNDSHYDKSAIMRHAIKFPGGYLSEMQAIYTSSLAPEYLSSNPLDAIRLKSLTDSEIEVANKLMSMFGGMLVVINGSYTVDTVNRKQIEREMLNNGYHY